MRERWLGKPGTGSRPTAAPQEEGLPTSLWALHNLQLWSPFKGSTSWLCATRSDTGCILTRGVFCQERDIARPEHLPRNQPPPVSQAQSRLEMLQIYVDVQDGVITSVV